MGWNSLPFIPRHREGVEFASTGAGQYLSRGTQSWRQNNIRPSAGGAPRVSIMYLCVYYDFVLIALIGEQKEDKYFRKL